jgi:hypothetical protein
MAKKVDYDPFGELESVSYSQLFDGSTWALMKGDDYQLATSTIVTKIREAHERQFGELRLKVDGDIVYVRHIK